ncbi:phosphoribosyltransferase [Candidatus Falkowbacteria bacterium]|nr:phosphoribosyltransferase [Candidatus Falkowbacteria bacterium]
MSASGSAGGKGQVQLLKRKIRPEIVEGLDNTLKRCGGFYETPKDAEGKRLGPLVGYAGKYDVGDGSQAHYVGEIFFNCAKLEQWPFILDEYAEKLRRLQLTGVNGYHSFPIFLGMPMGGITFAQALARADSYARAIYAEKKVIEAETATQREQSILVFDRHTPEPGDHVIITEDVVNNFSTTSKAIKLILDAQAVPIAIACIKNRSELTEYEYEGIRLPVLSFDHSPAKQYRQDDPYVAADIAAGNIVWKPKNSWEKIEPFIQ